MPACGRRPGGRSCRRGRREEVAALVGHLAAGRVLPGVQQRVGDDVLLLVGDLVDRSGRRGPCRSRRRGCAHESWLGSCCVGAFRPSVFAFFLFAFFLRRLFCEFFFFELRLRLHALLFLEFAVGLFARFKATVLAVVAGRFVVRGEVVVARARPRSTGSPRRGSCSRRRCRSRRGSCRSSSCSFCSSSVLLFCFRPFDFFERSGEVRAVAGRAAGVEADRHARRGQDVVDRAHAASAGRAVRCMFRALARTCASVRQTLRSADAPMFKRDAGRCIPSRDTGWCRSRAPCEDRAGRRRLVGRVVVLRVDREDAVRAGRSSRPRCCRKLSDQFLPVAVVEVLRVPVDRVGVRGVQHRVARRVAEARGRRVCFGRVESRPTPLARCLPSSAPSSRAWMPTLVRADFHDERAGRAARTAMRPRQQATRSAGGERQARYGEAGVGGHDPIIGSRRRCLSPAGRSRASRPSSRRSRAPDTHTNARAARR